MIKKKEQQELLEMVKILDDICVKEDISYMLHRGTLLGAVREHGFIEWDDDMDLIMPRRDFDAFEKCCPQYFTERGYYLENKGKFPTVCSMENPELIMEIVTLDAIPASPIKHKFQVFLLMLIPLLIIDYRLYTYSRTRKALVFILSLPGRLFSEKTKLNAFKRVSTWGNDDPTDEWFISNGAARFINLRIKKNLVDNTVRMPFEDTELPVPMGWDEYLRLFYGDDYMTPKRENYYAT